MLSRYLAPFTYYNLILLLLFSLSAELIESFLFINSLAYVSFHYVIIYLGLYYYRKILYIIYFLYGLGIDLLLINGAEDSLSVEELKNLKLFIKSGRNIFIGQNKIKVNIQTQQAIPIQSNIFSFLNDFGTFVLLKSVISGSYQ